MNQAIPEPPTGFLTLLSHLDAIVWHESSAGITASVQGWRASIFFNTGDIKSAFRGINTLLDEGDNFDWLWPWCEQLVGVYFGRKLRSRMVQFGRYLLEFSK